jgi:hypothetical protein
MDSNWIHGPSGQNGGAAPKTVLKINTILIIMDDSILVEHKTSFIGKVISLAFRAYVKRPKRRSYAIWTLIWIWDDPVLRVGLELDNSELDWFATSRARLLDSLAHFWCSVCPLWSSLWFLRTIKLLDSNRLSILYVEEHNNEFTWWFNCCACDHVIWSSILMEGMIVAEVLMSSSYTHFEILNTLMKFGWNNQIFFFYS